MAKGKLLGFYRDDEMRRKILNYIATAFLVLLMARVFLSFTFFDIPNLYLVLLAGGMAALTLLQLFFLLPDINDGLFFLWLLLLLALDISYITHFTGLEYICNVIIFLGMLTLLPHIRVKKTVLYSLMFAFVAFSFLVVLFANRTLHDKDTVIFMNTNTSSFICFLTAVLLIACGGGATTRIKWIFYALAAVWTIFLIPFGGRASMIGVVLFVGYFFLRKVFDKFSSRAVKWIIFGVCVFSVLFAYLYAVFLFDWIGGDNIQIFGKGLFSGRQSVWRSAFEQLKGNWIFGVGHAIMADGGSSTPNVHNQILGLLTCFGLITTVLFVLLLMQLTARLNARKKMTTAFIITLIIVSYFEIVLYSTWGMTLVPLVLVFIYHLDSKEGATKLTVHYSSLGKKRNKKWKYCIRSFKRKYPNLQFVEWDEQTYNIKKNAYLADAYEQKKYAYINDYMCLDVLYRYGGVWIDGETEIVKNILPFTAQSFVCADENGVVNPKHIACADGGEQLFKEILDYYNGLPSFTADKTAADITTEILSAHGLKKSKQKQRLGSLIVYPLARLQNEYLVSHARKTWEETIVSVYARYQDKYGKKKGKRIFALRHPILMIKKRRINKCKQMR